MSEERWNDNEYLNLGFCQQLNQLALFAEDEKEFVPFQGWNNYVFKTKSTLHGICEIDEIE